MRSGATQEDMEINCRCNRPVRSGYVSGNKFSTGAGLYDQTFFNRQSDTIRRINTLSVKEQDHSQNICHMTKA